MARRAPAGTAAKKKQKQRQSLAYAPVRAAARIYAEWRAEQERVRAPDNDEPAQRQRDPFAGYSGDGPAIPGSLGEMLRGAASAGLLPEAADYMAPSASTSIYSAAGVPEGYLPGGNGLVPVAQNGRPLTAAQIERAAKKAANWKPDVRTIDRVEKEAGAASPEGRIPQSRQRALLRGMGQASLPSLFVNPMQDTDYRLYESLIKHTFIGPLTKAFIKYLFGKGFEPELALASPSGDEEEDRKVVEAGKEIIEKLKKIDKYMDGDPDNHEELDTSFQDKMLEAITSMLVYNRAALIFDWDPPGPEGWRVEPDNPDEFAENQKDDDDDKEGRGKGKPPFAEKDDGEEDEEEDEAETESDEDDDLTTDDDDEEEEDEDEEQAAARRRRIESGQSDGRQEYGSDPISRALRPSLQAPPAGGLASFPGLSGIMGDAREPRRDFRLEGRSYPEIPHRLITAHARDLGMIRINPRTRGLLGVRWVHAGDFVDVEDMLYFWNPVEAAAVHNSRYYGMSILTPLIPPAKIMRQLLSDDFPAIAKATWARMYLLVAKNEGGTPESKRQEWEGIVNRLRPGSPAVLVKSPDDVNLFDLDFDPKIQDLISLLETVIRLTIAMLGLPQAGFHDEAAANRATMAGKLELNRVVNIEPIRSIIARPIERQWYNRWFRLLYRDDPKILKTYTIKVKFSNIEVAEWYDTVQAVLALDQRKPLRDEALGSLIGLDRYPSMVDLEKVEQQEQEEKDMKQQQMAMQQQAMQMKMGGGMPGQGGPPGAGGPMQQPPEGMRPGDVDKPSGPGDAPGKQGPPGGASPAQQYKNANQPGGLKPGKQGKAGKMPGGSRSFGRANKGGRR